MCDECFPPKPAEITDNALLKFVLSKFNVSRRDMEMELEAFDPKYKPTDSFVFTCQHDEEHDCGDSECSRVSRLTDLDESDVTPDLARGVCCVAEYKDDRDEWCEACTRATKKQKIVAPEESDDESE